MRRCHILITAGFALFFHSAAISQSALPQKAVPPPVRLALLPEAPAVDDAKKHELLSWLGAFQNVTYRMNIRDYLEMMDWDTLIDTTFSQEGEPPDDEKKARLKRALIMVNERMFPQIRPFFVFHDAEVRRIDLKDDEAIIIARVHDDEGLENKVRWWLRRHNDRWQLTDFENITVGMRLSAIMLTAFQASASKEGLSMGISTKFVQVGIAMEDGDINKAYALIQEIESTKLPAVMREIFLLAKVGVVSQFDDKSEELKSIMNELEKVAPDSPVLLLMRTATHYDEADYKNTIVWAKKIGASVGYDEDTWPMLVDAHRELQEGKEQLAAAKGWTLDYPNSPLAQWNYWLALPADERATKIRPLLERIEPAQDGLEGFASEAYLEDDAAALTLVIEVMQLRKLPQETLQEWRETLHEVRSEQTKTQPDIKQPSPILQ